MKKMIISIAVCALSISAFAGFDMYTGKVFTQLLAPVALAAAAPVTNSTVTGANVAGLVGNGAVIISANAGTGTVSVVLSQCTTTNGTYTTVTNAGVASWALTNTSSVVVFPLVPNSLSQYIRTTATPSTGTTGSVSVLLISN